MFAFIILFSLLLQSCNLFQLTSTLARTTPYNSMPKSP